MNCTYCGLLMIPRGDEQVLPDRRLGKWIAVQLADCTSCGTTRAIGEPRVLGDQEQIKYPSLEGLAPTGPRDIEGA